MSLFQRGIRPPALWSDEAVERYLAAIRAEISLDPLFRRRLRGRVVNRFVAEREGAFVPRTRAGARRMGALGRSVLYASVVLGVSVTGTMAASQGSVPGDAFYPLKRQIETLRFDALPAQFHDDLAAHALGERIEELGRLAERGDWVRVSMHAAAVAHDSAAFLELTDLDSASADRYLVVLNGLLDLLPARAQSAIEAVVDDVEAAAVTAGTGGPGAPGGASNGEAGGSSNGQDGRNDGGSPGGPGGNAPTPPASADPTPRPTPRAEPRATAKPDATPKPQPTPQASKKAKPSPTATEAPSGDSSD